MYTVQSVPGGGPPPLITHVWGACPSFSGGSCYGSASGCGGGSARVLHCFLSFSPLLSPGCPASEEQSSRRRRRPCTESTRKIQGVAARLEVRSKSSTVTARPGASGAPPAAPTPEILPEWFGGLGLEKAEEEDLLAAFVALPEPPPPADADAKLVKATRDLVVSLKEPPPGRYVAAESKGDVKVGAAMKRKMAQGRRLARKRGSLRAEKMPREGDERGTAEVLMTLEKPSKAATRLPGVHSPVALTSKIVKTVEERDRWLQERLRFDDMEMAKLRDSFPHVCSVALASSGYNTRRNASLDYV